MQPGLLVASPQLRDTHFARTVVLLLQSDPGGALGLVVNRVTPVRMADVLEGTPHPRPLGESLALWGGPVEPSMGFVLFRGRAPEGWQLAGELAVSGSRERLGALVAGGTPFHLCLGYAGWSPGQLEREFEEGSWVHVEHDAALVLDAPVEERYDRALAQLGLSADRLWMTPFEA